MSKKRYRPEESVEEQRENRLHRVCVLPSLPVTNWHFLSTSSR